MTPRFSVHLNGWTDAAVEWLDAEWTANKLSAIEMGAVLGCSANAVIGKAHRRLLPARPSPIAKAPPAALLVPDGPKLPRPVRAPRGTARPVPPRLPPDGAAPPQAAHAAPQPRHGQFTGEPDGRCAWPLGDPHRVGFRWCSAERAPGSRYCALHFTLGHSVPGRAAQLPGVTK